MWGQEKRGRRDISGRIGEVISMIVVVSETNSELRAGSRNWEVADFEKENEFIMRKFPIGRSSKSQRR